MPRREKAALPKGVSASIKADRPCLGGRVGCGSARVPALQNEQGIRKRAEEQLAQAAGERDSLRALLEAERAQQASRELAALRCGA